ncbi:hypothetical protein Ctaglu_40020 [Clostridium tagluense]|uniref:Uncharacterized protein n=1 Tax=Clostridium tagluense TaxID=360422 RepID=A0A401US45_9CLOT|nr:hypothetical protein Ctaglu_40020 [Clostridium tagluense]
MLSIPHLKEWAFRTNSCKKINKIAPKKDTEILLIFLSMAVLGIMESFVLNKLNASTEQIAKQVGELLAQNISLASH